MTHDPTRDCEQGRLKGKCDVCDLQAEVECLRRVNAELVGALRGTIQDAGCTGSDGWMTGMMHSDEYKAAVAALAKARVEAT